MVPSWKDYQEESAAFFRSLDLDAKTDVSVQGIHTSHDVDVLVTSSIFGFEVKWIVECKHWESPIKKLHVLALRQIVIDCGADRGILLSESGFQSGAVEAANLTNVQVTSLANLRVTAREQISAARFKELYDRLESCSERYWALDKRQRIEDGLRPDFSQPGYSGARVVETCRDLLSRAALGRYPIEYEEPALLFDPRKALVELENAIDVVTTVEGYIQELENKLMLSEEKRSVL